MTQPNLTDMTLADEDTNSILADNAKRAIQGNEAMRVDKFIVKSIITFNKLQHFETFSTRESP